MTDTWILYLQDGAVLSPTAEIPPRVVPGSEASVASLGFTPEPLSQTRGTVTDLS